MQTDKSKAELKWESDIKRRSEVLRAIDFYNNQQEMYTDAYLKEMYSEKAYKKLKKYMICDEITHGIIDDMSIMFQSGFAVTTGVPEADDFIKQVFDESQIQSLLIKVDRLVNLTKKVALVPYYDAITGKFYFDVITGDKCFIHQREDMPMIADAIYYSVGLMLDSPQITDQSNLYVRYTMDTKDRVEIDASGRVSKIVSSIDNPYKPYREVPFVWFNDDLNIDTFWSETGNQLVKNNLDINGLLINHRLMVDYQAFSTLVTTGLDGNTPLHIGPQFHLNLFKKTYTSSDPLPDAKYITPDAKLVEVWNIICAKAVKCAKSAGLSAQAYTTDPSSNAGYNSGYQLKLSKIDIINRNIMRQVFFKHAIRRLVRILLITSNIYTKTSFKVDNMDIRVTIYDPIVDMSPSETEQVRTQKIGNGTWSPIRSIMEDNPDISRDDAIKMYNEIQEELMIGAKSIPMFNDETDTTE